MSVYFEDTLVRYRTEAFSGTGERNAAEVMAFEFFTLGNTDILEYLKDTILKNNPIVERFDVFLEELEQNEFIDDMGTADQVSFMQDVLDEIKKETGIEVKYVLWLADKETVTDRKWYGRDMADDEDFESYQVGPMVLSELGFDGTLYGYEQMPVSLETRLEYAQDDLVDIINEREGVSDGTARAVRLDELYNEKDNEIQRLKEVIGLKMDKCLDKTLLDAAERSAELGQAAAAKDEINKEKSL